jgi:hypothetical protein
MHMLRWLAFYGMPVTAEAAAERHSQAGEPGGGALSAAKCRTVAADAGPAAEGLLATSQATSAPVRRGQPGPPLFLAEGAARSVGPQRPLAAGSADGGPPAAELSASPNPLRAWSPGTVVALLRHAIFHGADALHSRPHRVSDAAGPGSIAAGGGTSEVASTGVGVVPPPATSTWVPPSYAAHRSEAEGRDGDAIGPDMGRHLAAEEAEVAGRRAAQLLEQHPPARRARRNAIAFHSALAPVQLPLALQGAAAAEDEVTQAEHRDDGEPAVGAAAPPRSPPGPPPQPYDSTGLSFVAALHRYLLPSNPALYHDICQRAVYGGMRDRCWVRRRAIVFARDRAKQAWNQRHNDSPMPRGSVEER